jgi:hypothetical protein
MIELSFTESISRPRTDVFSILTDIQRGHPLDDLLVVLRLGKHLTFLLGDNRGRLPPAGAMGMSGEI